MEQETQTQTTAPAKKVDDNKITKILFSVVFFVVLIGLFALVKVLPFCKEKCIDVLSMVEVAVVPIMLCLSVLAGGALFNIMKKIPEKRAEIVYSDEVPTPMLMRILMTSYAISSIICIIPDLIYANLMRANCGDAEYNGCGSGVNIPYFAFFFPVTAALAIFLGYKLSYLLWVPLFEHGKYPNGNPIMKHVTPRKVKIMTFAANVLAVIIMLVIAIISIKMP